MLVVLLGDRALAIAAEAVVAVVRPAPVTPVPGTASWLAGVTAVRGRVLPVADLRALAGLPADSDRAGPQDGWLVVLDDGRRAAALAGLRVRRVVPCGPPDRGPDAPAAADAGGLPARGVVRLDGEIPRGADALPPTAALLDAAALLDLVHDPRTDGG